MPSGDPLKIHGTKSNKSEKIQLGIRAIEGHVYAPPAITVPLMFGGHSQAVISGFRSMIHPGLSSKTIIKYDREELFKYSDGGQTIVSFIGTSFTEPSKNTDRPILLVIPGLTSTCQEPYIVYLVKQAL